MEVDGTVKAVRQLALETVDGAPELLPWMRQEGLLPERPEEAPGDLPYARECVAICQVVYWKATRLGYQTTLVLGAFQDETDPEPVGHAWIEVGQVIIDPTSAQYGLERVAVIPPDDPRHAWYQPRRKLEGDDVSQARLD